MLKRLLCTLTLLTAAIWLSPAHAADESAGEPTLLVQIQSIDGLLDQMQYLFTAAGRGELAKQFDGLIKAMTGPKGLEGIDTTRPLGAYVRVGPAGVDSSVVVLVPVAEEKSFLDLLGRLNVKAEKGNDGIFTVDVENSPVPVYFRFANKYAYATVQDRDFLDPAKLLAPEKVLKLAPSGTLTVRLNLDQIPDNLKQIALSQFELQLANQKERREPGTSEAQHKLNATLIDGISGLVTSVVKDGGPLEAELAIDRKAGEITLEMDMGGKKGSPLAASIQELGKGRSLFGALAGRDSAVSVLVHGALPESVRKAMIPVMEQGIKESLAKEPDANKRRGQEKLIKALEPSLRAGELDAAVSLLGPTSDGHYTVVAGVKVQSGEALGKTLRELLMDLPAAQRERVKLAMDTTDGGVDLFRMQPPADDPGGAGARNVLGDNPIITAARDNAMITVAGPQGQEELKAALKLEPKVAPPVEIRVAFGQLARLMSLQDAKAGDIARQVFAGKKGDDTLRVTLEGGDQLRARLVLKAQTLKFFALLAEARQGGALR